MAGKIRLFFLTLIFSVLVIAFFAWRLKFLEIPVKLGLQRLTGKQVSFFKLEYRLFNRIKFENLKIGSEFKSDAVTVYFNPLKLIITPKMPQLYLTHIHFDKPWYSTDSNIWDVFALPEGSSGIDKQPSIDVSWKDGQIITKTLELNRCEGQLSIDKKTTGSINAVTGPPKSETDTSPTSEDKQNISADLVIDKLKSKTDIAVILKTEGPDLKAETIIDGYYTKKGDFAAKLSIPAVAWKGFSLNDSTGTFLYKKSHFSGNIFNSAGAISIKGKDLSDITFTSNLDINGLNSLTTGQLSLKGNFKDKVLTSQLNLKGFKYRKMKLKDIDLSFKRLSSGQIEGKCRINPSKIRPIYNFDLSLDEYSNLLISIVSKKKKLGKISGKLNPLNIKIDISRIPIYGIPLSFKMDLTKENNIWFFNASSYKKDWAVQGDWLNSKDWEIKATLQKLKMHNMSKLLMLDLPVGGIATGDIFYYHKDDKRESRINLKVSSLKWADDLLGDGKVVFWMTPEYIQLQNLALYSEKGTFTGHADIGLKPGINDCKINLRFHKYPFKKNSINGKINLEGDLVVDNKWEFNGRLKSKGFQVGVWPNRSLKSKIFLSQEKLKIDDFIWKALVNGSFLYNLKSKFISGKFDLANISLENLVSPMQGSLKGDITISGYRYNPAIKLKYSVPDSKYRNITFSQKGMLSYKNKKVYFEKVSISSGTNLVELKGRLWPKLRLNGNIKTISTRYINMLIKPPFKLDGTFSGPVKIRGSLKNPRILLEQTSKDLLIDKNTIDECTIKASVSKKSIKVDHLLAKFKDSELIILPKSSIILDKQKVILNSKWRNIHLGPADCFGNLIVKGRWKKTTEDTLTVNTTVTTENFWINDHNMDNTSIKVKYANSNITFLPKKGMELKTSGNVDIGDWPQVVFNRLKIGYKDQENVVVDGSISKNKWNFIITGKDISAETLAELLDLPVSMEGSLDLNIAGRGNIDRPEIEGSLNVSNGALTNIPFDNLNLGIKVKQDILTITRARLVKKEQYTIVADGSCPFYLTLKSKKRVRKKPLNITFTIEDGDIGLLKALSSDIKSARGDLKVKIHLTGTITRPLANGYIKILHGEVQAKKYFKKMVELNVNCDWQDNLLNIKEFTAIVGQGSMSLGGNVIFEGFIPKSYNIEWKSVGKKGISISIPQLPIPSPLLKPEDWEFLSNLSQGHPKFHMLFTGPAENPLLSGWIELENCHFTYPSLVKKGEVEDIFSALWPILSWDLEIRSGKNSWYDNELVSVLVQGGIKLTGKGKVPSVTGRAEAVRGTLVYLGTEFKINRGTFEVNKNNAYLEGEAETEVYESGGDVDTIMMYIDKAEISQIQPRFVSKNNSNLTSKQALSKASGIKSLDSLTSTNLRKQIVRLFDSTLTTPLAKNILRRSGLADNFRVQYVDKESDESVEPSDDSTLPELLEGTKYSLEKYLGENVSLGYSITFDQIQKKLDLRHEIELSYRWKKNIFLKGFYEVESTNPLRQFDRRITVEQRWRFGWPKKEEKEKKKD